MFGEQKSKLRVGELGNNENSKSKQGGFDSHTEMLVRPFLFLASQFVRFEVLFALVALN